MYFFIRKNNRPKLGLKVLRKVSQNYPGLPEYPWVVNEISIGWYRFTLTWKH